MNMYLSSLKAMEHLLEHVGEHRWCEWIREDIREWIDYKSVDHHLSAYGGMGSFNDVAICSINKHTIAHGAEVWADQLFNWIKSLCFALAKAPDMDFTLQELKEAVGYHDPALSAFVGGEQASREMRGLFEKEEQLQGARCLDCGYGELTEADIDFYLAQVLLPALVFKASIKGKLIEMIDDVLALDIDHLDQYKQTMVEAIHQSELTFLHKKEGFMRPCPSCGSDNTAVYRWIYSESCIKPGKNNLPVRGRNTLF